MHPIFRRIITILLLCLSVIGYPVLSRAGQKLETIYPYSMEKHALSEVTGRSTLPLYVHLQSFDVPHTQEARVTVSLPEGFIALPKEGWQVGNGKATAQWKLDADYAQNFDLLYLQGLQGTSSGNKEIQVTVETKEWSETRLVRFSYNAAGGEVPAAQSLSKKMDNKQFNWYIQSVVLPVDNLGHRDERAETGVIYVRDTTMESFRNRMVGDGSTSWAAVFNHPAAYLMLDMRNPQKDIRVLKFKAQLLDRATGNVVDGLITAGKTDHETGEGWAGKTGTGAETTALISLDGKKMQSFILPLYVDYFKILEGDYTLRITVTGGEQQKIQEVPLTIAKKHSLGFIAVCISGLCFLILSFLMLRLKKCLRLIGAKGAITVALFAAISFGGISLPSTILGDLVHALLGPFSSLVTGLLSGVMQYLLVMSLLVLYRKPGVLTLLYLVKYMLSGIMFGHFTPLGMLSMSVNVAVLEILLYLCGFYSKKTVSRKYMLGVALLLGLGDALISFINLEQMMFFYRLYYADWFLVMYMFVNGLLYSSIGCWLGYKTGLKLQQVVGE